MASGGYIPSGCPKSKEKVPRILETWTPDQADPNTLAPDPPKFTAEYLAQYR